MRRVPCSLVLIATFVATAVSPAFARKEVKPKLKALQHAAYHFVGMIDRDDTGKVVGGGFCSATAVGPHTLMLAEHCNDPYTAEVYVDATMDQVRHNDPKLRTYSAEKYFDHQDHMLLDLAQITFADYAPVQLPVAQPYQGEHFYFTGSPNGQPNQYREGYVTGKLDFDQATDDPDIDAHGPLFIISGPVQPGDSGSSLFDAQTGKLIGILTYGIVDGMFGGVFPIQFTQADLDKALAPPGLIEQPAPRPAVPPGMIDGFPFMHIQRHGGGGHGRGGHEAPPSRGPRGGFHGNPNVRSHWRGGRFDHDYYLGHFGVYHPFYFGNLFWYGPIFEYESVFVFDDCGFVLMADMPGEWQPAAVYIVEVNGLYYVANLNAPGLIPVQVVF